MKPITNEIQFFGTSQKQVITSLCNAIITNYNEVSGEEIPLFISYDDLLIGESYHTKNVSALNALYRKLNAIAIYNGDPLSIPVFLKQICTGKTKVLSQPSQVKFEEAAETYGKGQFRWDWQAYTLTPNELKAVRMYVYGKKEKVPVTSLNGLKYKMLDITACLAVNGAKWSADDNYLHNKFLVTVTNTETGEQANFDFYGSYHDYTNNVVELKENDLLNSFDCFISDGIAGLESFEYFCVNFGYDQDSRNAEKIYKECIKAAEKLQGVIPNDLYDFANELQEKLN